MDKAIGLGDASSLLSEMLITSVHQAFSEPYREPSQSSITALQYRLEKGRKLQFITITLLPYNIPMSPFMSFFSYFFEIVF